MVENSKQNFKFHFIQMKYRYCKVKVTFTGIFTCDQ